MPVEPSKNRPPESSGGTFRVQPERPTPPAIEANAAAVREAIRLLEEKQARKAKGLDF